nr:MAG TPA_asm: hypothetical protein [Caudoviricetes sp.]
MIISKKPLASEWHNKKYYLDYNTKDKKGEVCKR